MCMTSLGDVDVLLKQHDSPENGYMLRRKLGEWQVLRTRIIPLFIAYFKDSELVTNVVQLMVLLTTRVGLYGAEELEHLQHLQDYKEGFSKSEVFTILVRLLLDALDQEVGGQRFFKDVLVLIRNLVSVPDPGPGDAGFTPLRSRLQLTYIRHFFDEGVLSFFHFLGEQLVLREEDADQVWALADILYHICAHFDPQEMWQSRRGRNKSELAELLARDKADSKLITSQSSRHSRFGTSMQTFSADGSLNVSASVMQKSIIQKSSALLKKEFRNPLGTDKKQNMFHNPFFVDLAEGSVREHNQLNPHVRGSLDDRASHSERILQGYRSFLEQCTFLSSLISILRSTVSSKEGSGAGKEFNVPHLLNFVSWFLEFHRCQHAAQVAEAKKKNAEPPDLDIANLQGAIDVDMIQFTTARLREFGKVGMHHSQLMIVLRVLSQQVQIIKVTSECSGSDTRDCGDILVRHLVKADIMANLAWIMKNFKSSTHDPRILSYSVEVWDQMIILMNRLCERYSQEDFQVDRQRGVHTVLANTTVENEVSGLTDSRVVENLFHLLEKYRRLSPQLQSMLVELIYSIVKAHHTNIVLFFELSFFMRIYRIMTDPLLTSTKNNTKYKDLIGLLQFILQSFFQCAQVNSCVFAELLFRKVQEKGVVESTAEFAAILDNYEDDTYRRDVLDRIGAGDTLNEMKMKQKELQKGQQPWTDEEDNILKENHDMSATAPTQEQQGYQGLLGSTSCLVISCEDMQEQDVEVPRNVVFLLCFLVAIGALLAKMTALQKIAEIEAEMARTQKNKATNAHLGLLKAKLAKLRATIVSEGTRGSGGGGGQQGFEVSKTGDARVGLIGFPSVGKSTLLNKMTGSSSEVASYEFTTLTCVPGVFNYKGAKIQLLDLPGIIEGAKDGKGRGKQVISVAYSCSLILIVLDVMKPILHKRKIEYELEGFGIRLNKSPPNILFKKREKGGIALNMAPGCELQDCDEDSIMQVLKEYRISNAQVSIRCNATMDDIIDTLEGNRKYCPAIYVMNKIDQITIEELDIIAEVPHHVPICAHHEWNLDGLVEMMWRYMSLLRIYTKPRGQIPDYTAPVILPAEKNKIEDFCLRIHKSLLGQFKVALVWGMSVKHNPQRCGKDHQLMDEDVVQIIKKVG
ncbi:unnamed protein product [Durusdinium trenchii]|uniref:Uncharacterized protein n=1 Tax=Durusdinium trenchii TaxID=1381693 RepID=A0ABP0NH49_9DINO